jgi:pyruvate/2-oxoglutarate dehydrogenase complex dihydrolipoamide acyltransferase (E2) component
MQKIVSTGFEPEVVQKPQNSLPLRDDEKARMRVWGRTFHTANVSLLAKKRKRMQLSAEREEINLTYLPFIIKATLKALKESELLGLPFFGQRNQPPKIQDINIGLITKTKKGAICPLLRGAEYLSIFEISQELSRLTDRARKEKLNNDEIGVATLTLNNFTTIEATFNSPFLKESEVWLLGIGRVWEKVAPTKEGSYLQKFLPLSLTFEKKKIKSAKAKEFLYNIDYHLGDPNLLTEKRM